MHILLINANPVVSRLLVLCTRDESVTLDEVSSVDEVTQKRYDITFVDEASYGRDVAEMLVNFSGTKKVFISYRSDSMRGFDVTIKKPFLPSQITDIMKEFASDADSVERSIDANLQEDRGDETLPHIFPLSSDENQETDIIEEDKTPPVVLDRDEIEKIKELLDMDDDLDVDMDTLSEEEIESRKVALIKEQLIADGLEIVDESEIVEELSLQCDGTLTPKKTKRSKAKKSKKRSEKLKFSQKHTALIEDAVEVAMANMTKKQMKKLLKGKEIELRIKLEDRK